MGGARLAFTLTLTLALTLTLTLTLALTLALTLTLALALALTVPPSPSILTLICVKGLPVKLVLDDNDVTITGHPSQYLKG